MKHFQGAMREQGLLMPYDLMDWLPEDHLARFVVDIVDQLDLDDVVNIRAEAKQPMTPGC